MLSNKAVHGGRAERVAVKDARLVYRACSMSFAKALGADSPDEVIGKTDFDLFPPAVAREQMALDSQSLHLAQADISALALGTAEREQMILRTPIISSDREIRGLDIRLLNGPGDSGARPIDYQALINGGLQGTIVFRDDRPLFVNRNAARIFGFENTSDLLHKPSIAPLFTKEDWNRLRRNTSSAKNIQPVDAAVRLKLNALTATGQPLMLLAKADEVQWEGASATLLSIVDLDQPGSSPGAPSVNEQRYRHYARASADFFWETDENLRFSLISDELEAALGVTVSQLLGRTHEDLTSIADELNDVDHWQQHLQMLANHQPFRDFEFKWQIDGDVKMIRYSGIPVYDGNSEFMGYRGTGRDVTAAHKLAESVAYHASHDALTGLVNRREFENLVDKALMTARAERQSHALFFMDLDNFKIVNDTCGHLAGDELLRQLSSLLNSLVRKSDVLARLGGDEFGVFLYNCSVAEALKLANQIRSEVENFQFLWEENRFMVGVSIGLVVADDRWDNLAALFSAADSACYIAKDEGRNQVVVYREADGNSSNRKVETHWVEEINAALDDNRIVIARQKILPLMLASNDTNKTGSATQVDGAHFEILMRLVTPSGDVINPRAFLPSAERYGLSARLDSTVIDVTLDWLKSNPRYLQTVRHCSINLASGSFANPDFGAALIEHISESGIPPSKLCFELTETATIANLSAASDFMHQLHAIGCRFILDDFGAGLSSFAYLKNIPVDFLKIDGRLVRDIMDDQIDFTMVKAINEVGQSLGKQTIAEFVETPLLLEAVREIGVDYAQGFAVEKPEIIL